MDRAFANRSRGALAGAGAAHAEQEQKPARESLWSTVSSFLRRERGITPQVLVGLHRVFVDPRIVARLVAAHRNGAALASKLGAIDPLQMVKHAEFDWGDKKAENDNAPKKVPVLSVDSLCTSVRIDGMSDADWQAFLLMPFEDGPSVIGPYKRRVGQIFIGLSSYFVYYEGGKFVGWMELNDVPKGGFRLGDWLLYRTGDYIERIHDRPHDVNDMRARAPEMSQRDLERRAEAGEELNRDVEHFVALGNPISVAQVKAQRVHEAELVQMIGGTVSATSAFASAPEVGGDIEMTESEVGVGGERLEMEEPALFEEVPTLIQDKGAELAGEISELIEKYRERSHTAE